MSRLSLFAWIVVLSVVALSGVLFSIVVFESPGFIGAVYAIAVFSPIVAFEQDLIFPGLRARVNALPTVLFFITDLIIYLAFITAGTAVAGFTLWSLGLFDATLGQAVFPQQSVLLYSLCVSSALIFVLRMRDLIGREVFVSLLVSRYRVPVREERIFLFLDLVGSTSYAERHGDLRAQQYVAALVRAIAGPIRAHGGTINDYIGDAVIATWHFEKGADNARCVRCVFDIADAIAAQTGMWTSKFGDVPRLRAALHGGPVITGEIGVDHHKITFFGDTVNTTARIEGLCRTLGTPFLISDDLLASIILPAGISADPRGSFALRGRGQEISVSALNRP